MKILCRFISQFNNPKELFRAAAPSNLNLCRHLLTSEYRHQPACDFFVKADASECLAPNPIKIKGLKYLPGSEYKTMPEYLKAELKPWTTVLQPSAEIDRKSCGEKIGEAVNNGLLEQHEAVLFKNLPFRNVEELNEIITATGFKSITYQAGTAFREKEHEEVYEASAEDPKFTIEFHNEMSYLPKGSYPTKIAFACIRSGVDGGESPIFNNRMLNGAIDQKYLDKIREKKIRYMRNLYCKSNSDYITWQNNLETDCKEEAEALLAAKDFSWEWKENGDLQVWNILEGFDTHEVTGEEIFFNQITANHGSYYQAHPMFDGDERELTEYPYHVQYGDGEEFEEDLLEQIRSTSWKNATAFSLKTGDMILLDNMLVQHARMWYTGDRKLNVALLQ